MKMDGVKTISAVLLLLSMAALSAADDCVITTESQSPKECIGLYECAETVGSLNNAVGNWDCARSRSRQLCYESSHCVRIFQPVENYWLKIKVVNVSENLFKIYRSVNEVAEHVVAMTVTNGNVTFIPDEQYSFDELSVLDVSHNKIKDIDLKKGLKTKMLKIFNASFNLISKLVTMPDKIGLREYSTLSVIDLSHNDIRLIDDNYFSKFNNLLHLNTSYNKINSFSLRTFEGLTRLQTLYLSNNNIHKLGMSLARFSNLKELTLDHNDLSSIEENNFEMLSRLINLNLSFNKIIFIDDFSFRKMESLTSLQLNNNNIKTISKSMFIDNTALQDVDFSNNGILKIDPFSFKGANIIKCNFRNNSLQNLDHESIFEGFRVTELDLSINNINSLGENLFTVLHSDLQWLNLSMNAITHIHENTFRDLVILRELDLSYNSLQDIEFNKTDLTRLLSLEANNNQIRKITKNTFRHLTSLSKVNLSNNDIVEMETFSFRGLEAVGVLDLSYNDLPDAVAAHTFDGLSQTYILHLTHSKVSTLQDAAFFDLKHLGYLNASFGDIKVLGYNVFNGTYLRLIDLSHNHLETFNVNNTFLTKLEEIYLNDNKIIKITNETFRGMNILVKINLENNNILQVDENAFHKLQKISVLYISSNENMILDGIVFSNTTLRDVKLQNVWKPYNFRNSINTSLEFLDLTSSNITDINSVMVYKLTKLVKLLLSSNKIRSIDRYSFQNLSSLFYLDLSNNVISIIKPGSFAGTCEISSLNLHNNNLTSISFGVFDGLSNLQILNLSSNAIHSFQGRLFHNSHRLSVVSLEDNLIENIDFIEIHGVGIPKITIGGNLIPCDTLAVSKRANYYGIVVTSDKLDFHVENVDGISCKGVHMETTTYQPVEGSIEAESAKMSDSVHSLDSSSVRILNNHLNSLKTAIYLEATCLLIIVGLLSGIICIVYFKLRSKLVRTYSLSSRRHLTANEMEMEL